MRIYLIGLPGSGKSTLGKQLAKKLQLTYLDLDDEIVKSEGRSIDEIFSVEGEPYFRKVEKKALETASKQSETLISTGGGAPCFFDNMKIIKNSGISIFLNVPPETLADRILSPHSKRPMTKDKSREEVISFLEQKYAERLPFYMQADIIIESSDITLNDIIERLEKK